MSLKKSILRIVKLICKEDETKPIDMQEALEIALIGLVQISPNYNAYDDKGGRSFNIREVVERFKLNVDCGGLDEP